MSRASNTLTQAARTEELATWLLRHAEDDDNAALQQALAVLAPPDWPAEVIVVWEQAAQARDAAALERAAEQLADAGLVDEAIAFYLHGRGPPHPRVQTCAGLLESNDRTDEASQLERHGIAPDGHPLTHGTSPNCSGPDHDCCGRSPDHPVRCAQWAPSPASENSAVSTHWLDASFRGRAYCATADFGHFLDSANRSPQ